MPHDLVFVHPSRTEPVLGLAEGKTRGLVDGCKLAEMAVVVRECATRAALDIEGTEELAARLDRAVFDRTLAALRWRAAVLGELHAYLKSLIAQREAA